MTTNENDETPAAGIGPDRQAWKERNFAQLYGEGVKVEMAGRTLFDRSPYRAHMTAERLIWEEKALHTPGIVHALTGPDAGLPAEMERWESWHLDYVQKLATELQYTATTAASIMARRDGAL